MMYRLTKQFRFEASHQLPFHDGKCARLHGHSWVGEIEVEGASLIEQGPKQGMLIDYGDLGKALDVVVEMLDHSHLNDIVGLSNPTSEVLARWVYKQLKANMPLLVSVRIEETCTTSCEYRP